MSWCSLKRVSLRFDFIEIFASPCRRFCAVVTHSRRLLTRATTVHDEWSLILFHELFIPVYFMGDILHRVYYRGSTLLI